MKDGRLKYVALIFTVIIAISTIAVFDVRAFSPWVGYLKPAFPDYAPSGMPDFDEKQDTWGPVAGMYTWCGPVAAANSLWWLDSEYENLTLANPIPPPTASDHFPLVTTYNSTWDDHDSRNVDPLVRNLASLMNTDGQNTGHDHIGTRWQDLEAGINAYVTQQGLSKYFEVHDMQFADFGWINTEVSKCQDVILFLEFYQLTGGGWSPLTSDPNLESGHFVTCAGVNTTTNMVLISDPYQDAYETGKAPGRSPVPDSPGYTSTAHNNATFVSQDAYTVAQYNFVIPPPPPAGYPPMVWELQGYLQTMGYPAAYHAFIRVAVATSPKPMSQWVGYVKPSFPDYAPSGMPDFDEKQNLFATTGAYTWCVPVAVANSLWWLDSEYESLMFTNPVPPPTKSDHFNLVNSTNSWDDHDNQNVASLVITLAFLMDTDGIRTHDGHLGTRWTDVQTGIQKYLNQQGVANLFEVHNQSFPTFTWIDNETEKCQDVEISLEFWYWTGVGWSNTTISNPALELGHCVTCAGVNSTTSQLLISDPYQDAYESGTTPGRTPAIHGTPHNSGVHNDTLYVSQDAYNVTQYPSIGQPPPPPGYPATVYELQGYLQTMPAYADPNYHAFIKGAVATSPAGVHDVAVTNLTSSKTVICRGWCGNLTVTAQNLGTFPENFNVTIYANTTTVTSLNFNLASGGSATQGLLWNTTTFAYGNYSLKAAADMVPGEVNSANNNFTDGWVKLSIFGDITGGTPNLLDFVPDGQVSMKDVGTVARFFGQNVPPAPPECDVTGPNAFVPDGTVDMRDVGAVARHFGEHE